MRTFMLKYLYVYLATLTSCALYINTFATYVEKYYNFRPCVLAKTGGGF